MRIPTASSILLALVAIVAAGCEEELPPDASTSDEVVAPGAETVIASSQPSGSAGLPAPVDDIDRRIINSALGSFEVAYTVTPDPIPLNEPFSLEVWLDAAGADISSLDLSVDARMPHHRHGMNRVPTVNQIAPGRYRIDDMLMHMPGRWELHFDITDDGLTERAQDVITVD